MNRILVVSTSLTLMVIFDLIRPAAADEPPALHSGSATVLFSNDGVPINLLSAGAPLSVVAPTNAGRIQYGSRAWLLTKSVSCHLTADLASFEYRIDSQPVLVVTIEYRLSATDKLIELRRDVIIRADARLNGDLTITLASWPAPLPRDTWLPRHNGTEGLLGDCRAAVYAFGKIPAGNQLLIAIPMVTYHSPMMDRRVTLATDPYFPTVFRPDGVEWTYLRQVGLENNKDTRTVVAIFHDGAPADAVVAFYNRVLPDVAAGPDWLHDIAMVDYDYLSDGGQGWFNDIEALSRALPREDRGKVFLCLHGWYDWVGRYCFNVKTNRLDTQWKAFGDWATHKDKKQEVDVGGEKLDGSFAACVPQDMTLEQMHGRIAAARKQGFRVGLYFSDGLNICTGLPDFNEHRVLRKGGWVGPDTKGETYVQNPLASEVREFYLKYADAVLREYGDEIDALVWDETYMVPGGSLGSMLVPGYADRAMMRLVRSIAGKIETYNREHQRQLALLTSDGLGEWGNVPYSIVAHGTYQDVWCRPTAWSFGVFPNWRNTLWSCCWWPVHKWNWVEFGVRHYQAPVVLSNGFGDNTGFAELSSEMKQKVLDLFNWRKQKPTQLSYFTTLPKYEEVKR